MFNNKKGKLILLFESLMNKIRETTTVIITVIFLTYGGNNTPRQMEYIRYIGRFSKKLFLIDDILFTSKFELFF